MARVGRPRKPTALKALQGNPGHRPLNDDEPRPDRVASAGAPGWLHGEARAIWDELAPELHRLGLLTKLDVSALAGACRWWAIFRNAERALRRGLLHHTKANGRQARPELAIAHKAFTAAMDVFSRFGITPSERARLAAPAAKPAGGDDTARQPSDPLDQLAARRAARTAAPA